MINYHNQYISTIHKYQLNSIQIEYNNPIKILVTQYFKTFSILFIKIQIEFWKKYIKNKKYHFIKFIKKNKRNFIIDVKNLYSVV